MREKRWAVFTTPPTVSVSNPSTRRPLARSGSSLMAGSPSYVRSLQTPRLYASASRTLPMDELPTLLPISLDSTAASLSGKSRFSSPFIVSMANLSLRRSYSALSDPSSGMYSRCATRPYPS